MIGYVKWFDSNKTMSFKVSDKKLLKKFTKIWGRIGSLIGKKCDSDPVYGDSDKYMKTKTKSYGDKVNTNLQRQKSTKSALYKYLSLIMLDSVIKVNKMKNLINDDFDSSSSDESDNEFDSEPDSESDNESVNDESND